VLTETYVINEFVLYRPNVAARSDLSTEHINTVWAERTVLER